MTWIEENKRRLWIPSWPLLKIRRWRTTPNPKTRKALPVLRPLFPYTPGPFPCSTAHFSYISHRAGPILQDFGVLLQVGVPLPLYSTPRAEVTGGLRADFGKGDKNSNFFSFQSPAAHGMARTSSLNCLSCRNPYQKTPHSLNASPLFTEKPFVSSEKVLRRIPFPTKIFIRESPSRAPLEGFPPFGGFPLCSYRDRPTDAQACDRRCHCASNFLAWEVSSPWCVLFVRKRAEYCFESTVSEKRTHWASLSSAANSVSSAKNSLSSLWHTNKRPRGTHWVRSPELSEPQKTHWVRCLKPYSPKPYSPRSRLTMPQT